MKIGCVITEDRPIDVAGIIHRHMMYLPDWPVLHFGKLPIQCDTDYSFLPLPYKITGWASYNKLMTSSWYWNRVPFDRVLIFQHDSGMLKNWMPEFEQYDYVGAPWSFQQHGGNGGFSWRNVDVMRSILNRHSYHPALGYEDVFFCNIMKDQEANMAPRDVCEKFSVEGVYQLGSMAYHNIETWLTKEQCTKIMNQYQ